LLDQESFIDMLDRQLIEVRMAHVLGPNSALLVPLPFERQSAEHVIDPFAHLAHAPAGPGPQLRRYKIENRNPRAWAHLAMCQLNPGKSMRTTASGRRIWKERSANPTSR